MSTSASTTQSTNEHQCVDHPVDHGLDLCDRQQHEHQCVDHPVDHSLDLCDSQQHEHQCVDHPVDHSLDHRIDKRYGSRGN
jgi:hypothetical protein